MPNKRVKLRLSFRLVVRGSDLYLFMVNAPFGFVILLSLNETG